jgi:hypothetical protein
MATSRLQVDPGDLKKAGEDDWAVCVFVSQGRK